MKFLSLLLGLVIFIAVLYQSVFTPAINQQAIKNPANPEELPALQTLKQARQLQQSINNRTQETDYQDRMKQY